MTRVLGAVLAGGQSRRFGSDKALAPFRGLPLIDHVIAALRDQCEAVVICGRAYHGFDTVADRPGPGLGPLGGLAAALRAGHERGFDAVLSVPCDAPQLPGDLLERLGDAPAFVVDLPVIGLWPCALAATLDRHIAETERRSMRGWAERIGATPRRLVAIANVNTPAELLAIDRAGG